MNCANPFVRQGQAFGCGQCLPCRINRKRIWTHRLMLEAREQKDNAFITLTYDDENLPPGGTLDPAAARNFLKRLRKAFQPQRFRYFLVGEYGEQTERPHYHAALFGVPSCRWGGSRYTKARSSCCVECDRIRKAWPAGSIFVGDLTAESAAYVAGYVTKKLTSKDDERLHGRYPEFARMSNRPGIGAHFMDDVASSLLEHSSVLDRCHDVPSQLCHGGRSWPLGRYLRRRLRERVGRAPDAPKETLEEYKARLHLVRKNVEAELEVSLPMEAALLYSSRGKRLQIEARNRIYKKRGSQ